MISKIREDMDLDIKESHWVLNAIFNMVNSKFIAEGFALYDLGSYPGVIHSEGHKVKGEVYSIDSKTLRKLDMLEGEGSLYIRKLITVVNDKAEAEEACINVYNQDVSRKVRVNYDNQPWGL